MLPDTLCYSFKVSDGKKRRVRALFNVINPKPTHYLPIKLLSKSQTVAKPK